MRTRQSIGFHTVLIGVLLSTFASYAKAQVTDLGAISAFGINNNGQVVAWQTQNSVTQGVVWQSGNLTLLPPMTSGNSAYPYAINDSGTVCGQADSESVKWVENTDGSYGTPNFVYGTTSWAYGIDSSNDIVGRAVFNGAAYALERTSSGTLFFPCGNGSDGAISGAEAVNDQNHSVGFYISPSGGSSYGFFSDGVTTPTSTFYLYTGMTRTYPRSINYGDTVVGETSNSTVTRGFVWQYKSSGGSPVVLLPLLPSGSNDSAFKINNSGTIVGWADYVQPPLNPVRHAAMWTLHNGSYVVTDLNQYLPNNSGWVLNTATGINDAGEIVGNGTLNGQSHAFILVLHGVDVSSYTGAVSYATWQQVAQQTSPHTWNAVVADSWQGQTQNPYAAQQLGAARAAGFPTAAYCFLNFTQPTSQPGDWQVQQALNCLGVEQNFLAFMAIDVESQYQGNVSQSTRVNLIAQAVNAVLNAGLIPILYTKQSDWTSMTGLTSAANNPFTQLSLWDTQWDTVDDLEDWSAYGGWTARQGKQYGNEKSTEAVTLRSQTHIGVVDPDVFSAALFPATQPVLLPLLSFNTALPTGGGTCTGTLGLSGPGAAGGVTVSLATSDSTVAWPVDATGNPINSLTVPATTTTATFKVKSVPVATTTLVMFTATHPNGNAASAAVVVQPPTPLKVSFSPNPVTGGNSVTGTVLLNGKTAVDTTVKLKVTKNAAAIASLPASVTVLAGSSSATFTVVTNAVTTQTVVSVQATANLKSKAGTLTVNP